jgi:malto-oligosyltrehalose trehalohydrolase
MSGRAGRAQQNGPLAADWAALQETARGALPEFLMRQRWYPAKDAGRPEVQVVDWLPITSSTVAAAVVVWRVAPSARDPFEVFVPLALVPTGEADRAQIITPVAGPGAEREPHALVDAFSVDPFVRLWVAAQIGGREIMEATGGPSRLRAGRTEHIASSELGGEASWQVRRSRAEQSNTSLRIGTGAILKVIRKLEQGVHPELEIGRHLSGLGFSAVAPLVGWVELESGPAGAVRTLSILQGFVPNQGDGWTWVLAQLARALGAESPGSRESERGRGSGDALEEVGRWLEALARTTADLHRAFAADSPDPAFRPEPVTAADRESWAAAARGMWTRAAEDLAGSHAGGAEAAARQLASEVRAREQRLFELIRASTHISAEFAKTRHHGDFHLGQVLVVPEGAIILDFEGEPLRPLADRRAKHSVLRDVAGLVRSLSYAAEAALRALPQDLPPGRREAAHRVLAAWESAARRRFVQAYFAAASGIRSLPAQRSRAEQLLQFFLLEKALYEVVYELANRPDWVAIPLRGVLELLEAGAPGAATVKRSHAMPFGAQLQSDQRCRFRLWAPAHERVALELEDTREPIPMGRLEGGWFESVTDRARPGTRYRYVLADGLRVPDPASRFQPEDVHGPSEVIDPTAYEWSDGEWRGRPWEQAVVYELHIGAFTPEGTFRGAIGKLDHLVELGVTALEIMPVSDFPGRRNWGYDGVLPYAPDGSYGRPEDLKALVDAAHRHRLMVLLDVVYNHFGPEGAYLHSIAPQTFTDRHETPWGAAINTDGPEAAVVREFFIQNALYWIEEFHLDGLRLDAVHAILDDSPKHLLEELAERVRGAASDRLVHLVLENEENEARRLARGPDGRPRWYTAQWNDDVHHVLHVAATGESTGYYADYLGDARKLGRALAEGFAFQGEMMSYRGHPRGEPSASLPPSAFVAFIQNHDQVGNRAFGERLTAIAPKEAVRAVAAIYLLLPQIPMLFMGEEWAAEQPFPFFCDFGPELADAVRTGRREEFARFPEFHDPATRERIPDPLSDETFQSAKLAWSDLQRRPHAEWHDWYRRVLAVRRERLVPRLHELAHGGSFEVIAAGAVLVQWRLGSGEDALVLEANLSAGPVAGFPALAERQVLWQEGACNDRGELARFSVRWSLGRAVRHHGS